MSLLNTVQHIKRRHSYRNDLRSKSQQDYFEQKNDNPKIASKPEYEQKNTIHKLTLRSKIEPYISTETMDTNQGNKITMIEPGNKFASQDNPLYLVMGKKHQITQRHCNYLIISVKAVATIYRLGNPGHQF